MSDFHGINSADKPPLIICEHGAFLKGSCLACKQLDLAQGKVDESLEMVNWVARVFWGPF